MIKKQLRKISILLMLTLLITNIQNQKETVYANDIYIETEDIDVYEEDETWNDTEEEDLGEDYDETENTEEENLPCSPTPCATTTCCAVTTEESITTQQTAIPDNITASASPSITEENHPSLSSISSLNITSSNPVSGWTSVSWDCSEGSADGFQWKLVSASNRTVAGGLTARHSHSFTLSAKTIYTLKIRTYAYTDETHMVYSDWKSMKLLRQPTITSFKRQPNNHSLKLSWNKQQGVSSYDIYISKHPNSGFKKVKSVGKQIHTVTLKKYNGKKIRGTYYAYIVSKSGNATSQKGVIWKIEK